MKRKATKPETWSAEDRASWIPAEELKPSEWAEKYRKLAVGQSNIPGPYRNKASPYCATVMDLCVVPGLAQLVIIKCAQAGLSEALRNVIGYCAHLVPDPICVVLPDEKKGRSIIDNRILPMFRETAPLKRLMTERSADATKQQVKLKNGFILHLMWSGSAASMASDPTRVGVCDEVDKFAPAMHSQGEPVSLVKARLRTYGDRALFIAASTPSTRFGQVWRLFDDCSIKAYFYVPCPHCGERQRLVFSGLKFEKGPSTDRVEQAAYVRRNASVWYECANCKGKIIEAHKPAMIGAGRYQTDPATWKSSLPGGDKIHDAAGQIHECLETVTAFAPGTSVGVHVSGLYCLWLSWAEIAEQFILAQGVYGKMFSFKTDTLGEPFDDQTTKLHTDIFSIKSFRSKLKEGIIPKWAVGLSATVDTQHRFFKAVVRAWGPTADGGGMESHRVWHGRLQTFQDLDRMLLARLWEYEDNACAPKRVDRLLIDTGGTQLPGEHSSRTDDVYRWIQDPYYRRQNLGVVGIKGTDSAHGREQLMHYWRQPAVQRTGQGAAAKYVRTGLELVMIHSNYYADELAYLIAQGQTNEAEEIWHLNTRNDAEYNQELSNCVKVESVEHGKPERVWRPVSDGATIDLWDCEVYQVVAAYMMEIDKLPSRAAIEAQRQQYRDAMAAEAQRDREREREKKLREESETRPREDDAWTPKKFTL